MAVTTAVFVELKPVVGAQVYPVAPLAFAVSTTDWPLQIEAGEGTVVIVVLQG